MNAIAQMLRAMAGGVVRDLGTLWVKSLVTRAVLAGLALLSLIAAVAFLLASAHSALGLWVGPLFANLIVAALLAAIGGGLVVAGRLVRKRAMLRRQQALNTVTLMVGTVRAAASTAASRNALTVVVAALVAGFLFGNTTGDGGDEDE